MKTYEIWIQGYKNPNQKVEARLMATVEGEDFNQAVKLHVMKELPIKQDYWVFDEAKKQWSFSGLKVFETKALAEQKT